MKAAIENVLDREKRGDINQPEFLHSCRRKHKYSLPFVIARRSEEYLMKFKMSFATDYRRSNLPSLIDPREVFITFRKSLHCKLNRREIASGMQQRLAESILSTSATEPRNDEVGCEEHELQGSHKKLGVIHISPVMRGE